MQPVLDRDPASTLPPVQVRVVGPEAVALTPSDLRRLFRGRSLTEARRQRLAEGGRVMVTCGGRVVGIAAYETEGSELRVHEFGVDAGPICTLEQITGTLVEALETACLAGGGRRLVVLPRAVVTPALLQGRGFATIGQGCAGSWFEKSFPS